MFKPKTNYAKIAFDSILFYVSTGQVRKENTEKITDDLKLSCACIVSVYDLNDNLRGYFGDVIPNNKMLYDEIVENAVGAASKKKNVKSIQSDELDQIKVYVDILSVLHKVEDFNEIKPQKHGLYIKDTKGKSGFIMPDVKGVKTIEDQIETIRKKSGITEKDYSKLEILFFKSTRYD